LARWYSVRSQTLALFYAKIIRHNSHRTPSSIRQIYAGWARVIEMETLRLPFVAPTHLKTGSVLPVQPDLNCNKCRGLTCRWLWLWNHQTQL